MHKETAMYMQPLNKKILYITIKNCTVAPKIDKTASLAASSTDT
jgi:hypothetical protein